MPATSKQADILLSKIDQRGSLMPFNRKQSGNMLILLISVVGFVIMIAVFVMNTIDWCSQASSDSG